GSRQKKGLLFETVSARPLTVIGLGTTKPLKLPTASHLPPRLVTKRAFVALSLMVKGGGAKVPLPITKLLTRKGVGRENPATPLTAVSETSVPSSRTRTKLGGLFAHSYTS